MQEHYILTEKEINDDLLSGVFKTPKWWPPAADGAVKLVDMFPGLE